MKTQESIMADITQEQLDAAVEKAVEATNAKRDKAEKGLKSQMERLLTEKKTEKERAEMAQAEAVAAAEDKARKDGDFEAMDKSWQEKYAALEAKMTETSEAQTGIINKLTAGADNLSISAEIGLKGSESVLAQLLSPRVTSSIVDGIAKTVYLDKDGKPSAATREEFIAEIKGSAAYAPLLAGSQGSGGGAAGQDGGAGDSNKGNIGGSKAERTAAIAARHPELK